jgi:hypothetical protein
MWAMAAVMIFMSSNCFAEEAQKWPKIKAIQKTDQQEIQFLDNEGKVSKKISLESETAYETKTKQIGQTKKTYKVRNLISKMAGISKNGKFVLLSINTGERAVIGDNGQEEPIYDGYETGKIKLYDVTGKVLWEKTLPEGRGASSERAISDNGEIVAVWTWDSTGEGKEQYDIIIVYDKKGNEVLRVPSKEDRRDAHIQGDIILSPNGRYMAINIRYVYEPGIVTFTRFYNLENKKYWNSGTEYGVKKISDEGIAKARIGFSADSPLKEFDIRGYLGE